MAILSDSGPLALESFPCGYTYVQSKCALFPPPSCHLSNSCHLKQGSETAGRWPIKFNPPPSQCAQSASL